ncbi:DUF4825 domain-containing protein [Streptococcus suis]|nr:DUF4825 domain-containing protein [Streptococcus suis]
MRKYLFLVSCLSLVFLAACQAEKSQEVNLEQYKTDYVGDNSKVIQLAALQDYPEGYTYDHIEIQSDKEPYQLTVFLKVDKASDKESEELQSNSQSLFDLIGNLEQVAFVDATSQEEIAHFTRKD